MRARIALHAVLRPLGRQAWDNDNRLKQLSTPTGVHSYEYDAHGLRTKQVTPSATTRYLLDDSSIAAEIDASGSTSTSHLHNPQIVDETLGTVTAGQRVYPLTDALGSVVALTDANGTVVRAYSYEAYGQRTTSGTGANLNFGFTGREHDASGFRYHRDRYADASAGRWNQPDRLGFVDGPNVYQYAHSNPSLRVDPSGQIAPLFILAYVLIAFAVVTGLPDDDREMDTELSKMALAAGLVAGTAALCAAGQSTITLYRAVSQAEAAQVARTGTLEQSRGMRKGSGWQRLLSTP